MLIGPKTVITSIEVAGKGGGSTAASRFLPVRAGNTCQKLLSENARPPKLEREKGIFPIKTLDFEFAE